MQARAREYMERANHDYFLREQIHAIQDELGEGEDEDIVELRSRAEAKSKMNRVRGRASASSKELQAAWRARRCRPRRAAVSQNYIEYMLELPWGVEGFRERRLIRQARSACWKPTITA